MDRSKIIIGEARLNDGRQLSVERSKELAEELENLITASRELVKHLDFDDQASDYMRIAMEISSSPRR